MFKVFISGETIGQLKANAKEFWEAIEVDVVETQRLSEEVDNLSKVANSRIGPLNFNQSGVDVPAFVEATKQEFARGMQKATAPSDPNAPKDSRGIAFDARIHSKEGEFNKNGTWRYRRNADKALIRQLENAAPVMAIPGFIQPVTHLPQHNAAAIGSPVPSPTTPPQVAIPFSPPANPAPQPMTFQQATQPPAPVVATPFVPQVVQPAPIVQQPTYEDVVVPASTQPAHDLVSFKNNFATTMNQLITGKKIDQPWIAEVNRAFGIQNIWEVTKSEAQLGQLFDCLCQNGLITKVG